MDKKSSFCVLFLVLLLVDSVILEKLLEKSDEQRAKSRQKRIPLPLVYYGAVISYQVSNNNIANNSWLICANYKKTICTKLI